jgi:aldehyde:ferredoxin oxidoreductase
LSNYTPTLLRVNLSKGTCKREDIPEKTVMDFIGGRGLGIKYLYDELRPGTDPLSPDNKLIFSVGPLAGTGALGCSRWVVTTKSPLSGGYHRSVGGADFGAWLKFAGLDMIIVEGKAAKPVYLYMEDGRCEIKDARELWGKNTIETQERLNQTHGSRTRTACIGPAAEKRVRFALILSERRTAGRAGMGTVMGSKNLKAIAINPAGGISLPNPKEFKGLIEEQAAAHRAFPRFPLMSEEGTTSTVETMNAMGIFPARNFREGSIDNWERIIAGEYAKIKERNYACHACMLHCGNVFRVKSGPYAGATSHGPDYETINMFTGSIGSTDIGATVAFDALCDELGIDTISTGNCIGFAYELFERGILTTKDTGGLDLTYGNHQAALELARRIGNREGLGDILAEGVKRAAERIGKGAEAYAMHVKGIELPAYDPRAAKWQGLNYITGPCGAVQNTGYSRQEIQNIPFPRPVDRFAEEGFADITMGNQNEIASIEVGVICAFVSAMTPIPLRGRMIASATGIPAFSDPQYLSRTGERIFNLERAFNIREGFGRKDDVFPKRITTEPLKKAGLAEGQVIRNAEGMLDEYYQVRGWDKDGIPTPEKLKGLGLEEVIKDIKR